MTKVGIIGATGYGGAELVRLLLSHPKVEIVALSSVSFAGQNFAHIYPAMGTLMEQTLVDDATVVEQSDVIFAALPHGHSQEIAKKCSNAEKIFIDLGADFRLQNEEDYTQWYDGTFLHKELHEKAVYGLPELFREQIKQTTIVANPGCYPTASGLALAPLVATIPFVEDSIIIDAKSGVTGAGRTPTETTHFPHCNENFSPYKIASHRHTPEIEQTIALVSGKKVMITFTPHLLPINRGILSTIYIKPVEKISGENLHQLYSDFYKNEPFVRVLPLGSTASINQVTYSNYCNISLHTDDRTGRVILVSAIDNMVKGAAGQAIQNMNIIQGFEEGLGINQAPPAF